MKENNKYFAAGSLYLIGNIFNKGVVFLTVPVFTRILSTYDYGIINTYTSWVAILSLVLGMSFHMAIRAAFIDYKERILEFNASITFLSIVSSILITIVTIIVVLVLNINIEIILVILCLIQGFATAIISNYSMYLMMRFKYRYRTLLLILPNFTINIISIIVIVFVFEADKYMGRILPSCIITLIIALIIIVQVFKKSFTFMNVKFWKYALGISVPIIFHGLSLNILSQSDRIMITSLIGAEETGIYSLIYNFSMIARVVSVSLEGVWVPWFTKELKNKKIDNINKRVKLYLGIMTYTVIGIILISPEVLMILAPKEYWDGKILIPFIVLSSYIIFIYTIYVNVEHYYKKTKNIATNTIIAATCNVVLNLIFIPRYGMYAAAVTTLISYLISLSMHYSYSRSIEKNLFPLKIILKQFIYIIIVIGVFYVTLSNAVFRWSLLILITSTIVVKYRQEISSFFFNKG